MNLIWIAFGCMSLILSYPAFASVNSEEKSNSDNGSERAAQPADVGDSQNSAGQKSQRKKSSKSALEKDAEGTHAPNRFNQEAPAPKSKYKLNGKPLEVDTD